MIAQRAAAVPTCESPLQPRNRAAPAPAAAVGNPPRFLPAPKNIAITHLAEMTAAAAPARNPRCFGPAAALLGLFLLHAGPCSAHEIVTITDENFAEYSAKEHMLLEFYAPWCGHCKKLKPDYEKAAGALKVRPPPSRSRGRCL